MTAQSWISQIAQVVHGATETSGFMIFRSYMDEAGIDGQAPYVSIAGYVAPVSEWEKFENDWHFVLNEYMKDISEPLRYFHALEFYGNAEKYRRWTPSKRASFINALFRTAAFLSMTEDERRYLTGGVHNGMKWKTHGAPTKPYFLPFQFCIIRGLISLRMATKCSRS
jgi:hypothetical protein